MRLPRTTHKVSISLPEYLLDLTDRRSFRAEESRSSIVAKALKLYLAQCADSPEFWALMYNDNSGHVMPLSNDVPA